MKLISMIGFVFSENVKSILDYPQDYKMIRSYGQFLKQPLTLGMFVPCDLDGNVLYEVTSFDPDISSQYYAGQIYNNELFNQAKERVLFEGFTGELNKEGNICLWLDKEVFWFGKFSNETIERLVDCDLTLTQSAIKQIGL